MKKAVWIALAVLWAGHAVAEAQFGIQVYPGAREDAGVAKALKETFKMDVKTYRTADPPAKVVDFYRKQPLKENPGGTRGSAGFSGDGVMVTVQNPWADVKTGKTNNDTLISIGKK